MARRDPQPFSLTAAASELKVSSYEEAALLQLSRQAWTDRAWSYYENVGEVRYAANFVANSLSRLRLIAAKTPPVTSTAWEPQEIKSGPVADAVHKLQDPRGGQRGLLRSLGLNLFIPGEAFLLGMKAQEGQTEHSQTWECLSSDELDTRSGYPQFFRKVMPNTTPIPLPDTALVVRVWKEHPRWSMLADSAMRTVLDQCETLLLLTRMERAAARSRFAGSGILFIPNELLPSGSRGESDTDFYSKLMEAMIAPIRDESHPSSVVPLLLSGPGEQGKNIQHITMDRNMDGAELVALKEDAVKRLAAAFDLPSEVLTGNSDLNHWGMAVVREETFAAHIQPFAEMVVDALTVAYLRPALKRANVPDWETYQIWFDKSGLVQKADQSENADLAHDRFAISDEAYRKAKGFTSEDAPDEEERTKRIGIKLVDARMAVLGELPEKAPDPIKMMEKQAELAPKPAPAGGEAGSGSGGRGRRLETVQPKSGGARSPQGARAKPPTQASQRRVSTSTATPTTKPTRAVVASADVQHLALKLGALDMAVLAKLQVLFESGLQRTAERAGAMVRSKSASDPAVTAAINGVSNRAVLSLLGGQVIEGLGFDLHDLLERSSADVGDELELILLDGYSSSIDMLSFLAERAERERLITTRNTLADLIRTNIAEARRSGNETLRELAYKHLFKAPGSVTDIGELTRHVVQPGDVRGIMARAGGGAPFGSTQMPGGIGTGRTVLEYADTLGVDVKLDELIWLYGDVPRKKGFQGHKQLHGAIFTGEDDPVLAVWPEDEWLLRTHYTPGDHRGCACVVTPVIREADGSLVYPEL